MTSAWISLLIAGFFEVGWPVGLKMSQSPGRLAAGLLLAAVCLGLSTWFLWLATKEIPLGTAYAIWTGIGAAGAFLVGILFYQDPAHLLRFLGVLLIISGVIVLKVA